MIIVPYGLSVLVYAVSAETEKAVDTFLRRQDDKGEGRLAPPSSRGPHAVRVRIGRLLEPVELDLSGTADRWRTMRSLQRCAYGYSYG